MPVRTVSTDKPFLERKGFRFMGPNGTVEFTREKTGFHISIHGEGNPATWSYFHLKLFDFRFGTASFLDQPASYVKIFNEGPIMESVKGVLKPKEKEIFEEWRAALMATLP